MGLSKKSIKFVIKDGPEALIFHCSIPPGRLWLRQLILRVFCTLPSEPLGPLICRHNIVYKHPYINITKIAK